MLPFITLIFCCQLAGELLVKALDLPIPGPVAGMVVLFFGLVLRGAVPDGLDVAADALIKNLSLLFIPAGVGVMLHVKLIGQDLLPISMALVTSTILTIVVTAWTMVKLSEFTKGGGDLPSDDRDE